MPFKGITFAGQNVTPKNDGGLYQAHYGDGILWGCEMALSGDDLVIQSGEFIMGGRVVQVDGATSVDLSGRTLQTGYIQVIMNADLTQGEGSQWYTTFVESATTTFPALTQDAINDNGDLYQIQLAIVQVSGGNLTSIYAGLNHSWVIAKNLNYNPVAMRLLDDGTFRIGETGAGGSSLKGMSSAVGGQLILFTDSSSIVLHPNGIGSNVGEVYFDVVGQQHGGHQIITKDSTSTVSLSGAYTSVLSQSLDAGLWDITGVIGVKGLNSANIATINLWHTSGYAYARNTASLYTSTANTVYISTNLKVNLTATTTEHIYASASSTASCTEAHFRAIQIG